MRNIFLASCYLLAIGLLGGPAAQAQDTQTPHPERPNYRGTGLKWEERTPPDSSQLRYTVFLIGDVGKPADNKTGGEPSLNFLRRQMLAAGSRSTTIFLGDNVYEYGLPPEDAPDRRVSEERLTAQLDILRDYRGEKYMIPGNHDWKQGLKGSVEQVNREQQFAEAYLARDSAAFAYTGDFYVPRDACPGPYEIRLADDLTLIAINSQWFLQDRERPYGANNGCGVANETDFFTQLEDIIARNAGKNIMIVAHHPLFSDGIHGGYFTLTDHLFPLSIVYKYGYLPLPVIGSIYPLARKYGGISQDLPHPLYQAYKKGLMDIFKKYPNLIYANGHEHNLQFFREQNMSFITSGSGCKVQHVKPGRGGGALFSDKEKGFARVNYYANGEVWTEYWIPDGRGETGRLVFRAPNYARQVAVATQEIGGDQSVAAAVPARRPNYQDSTVTVAVNPAYAAHGAFHDFLFGHHYRREWATPVRFPVLDLAREHDGLTPYKVGGGKQTASLKLRNDADHDFTLRTLDKNPAAVLPDALRAGAAKDVLQDQISAQHPYGAFALPPLAAAAGILHLNPVPRYVPQDPLLGQYFDRFANTPVMLEEDAKDNQSNVASLGNARNIVGTDKVLERLQDDNDNHVDAPAFARSRLFDMWIGDWDRHEDQWRWAEHKGKDDQRTYTAVPEDRDIAFFKGDGLLPYLASRKWAVRNFQNFGYDYGDWKGLNLTALGNDRRFLGELTQAQWVQLAQEMKAALTNQVIEDAFKQRWPAQIYAEHGPEIVAKLKSRRDLLPQVAADYYGMLNKVIEVKGSRKRELFEVERLPGRQLHVTMTKISKKGKTDKVLFDKLIDGSVTKDVRLYGFAGNDIYKVTGQSDGGPVLRIIGGTATDTITDDSRVGGLLRRHKTQIYDADTGNVIRPGREARLRLEPGTDVSRYDLTNRRIDRKDARLNYLGPAAYFGYNIDDGLFVGGGATYRTYGFRREPFATEQTLVANWAPARDAYNIRYTGAFTRVLGAYDLKITSQLYGPQLLYNYFGLGNDSRNALAQDDGHVSNREINDNYRIRFARFYFSPVLERSIFSFLKAGFGPQYDQFRASNLNVGQQIRRGIDAGYDGAAVGIRPSDFQLNRYLGARAYLNLDAASSPKNPRIGLRWYNSAEYNRELGGEQLSYGRLASEFRAYVSPNFPFQLTWAGRVGVAHNIGDYRFYQANTLGGTTNLRGYRRTRYAGRSSLYGNLEARLQLFTFNAYLVPGKIGLLGLADAARVYTDAYDTTTGLKALHTALGGGVWVDVLKQAVINITYSAGEERLVFVGFDFLF